MEAKYPDRKILLDATAIISGLTLLGYSAAYSFYSGVYTYYGIPISLVQLNIQHLFPSIVTVFLVVIFMSIVLMLGIILGGLLLIPILGALNWARRRLPKRENNRGNDIPRDQDTRVRPWPLFWLLVKLMVPLLSLFILLSLAFSAGLTFAANQTYYYVSDDSPNCLIVGFTQDSYVCSTYDPRNMHITDKFSVVKLEKNEPFQLTEVQFKPWPPSQPSIGPFSILTLLMRINP